MDLLEGIPVSPETVPHGVSLYLWASKHGYPPDFLDYPAGVVDEVMHCERVAPSIEGDIAERRRREAENAKKARGETA